MTDQIQVPLPVLEALVEMADKLAQLCDVSPSRERKLQFAEKLLADHRKGSVKKVEPIAEQTESNANWGTWG